MVHICCMDCDALTNPGWLSTVLLEWLQPHKGAASVGNAPQLTVVFEVGAGLAEAAGLCRAATQTPPTSGQAASPMTLSPPLPLASNAPVTIEEYWTPLRSGL